MFRCARVAALVLLACAGGLLAPAEARAQAHRPFPPLALRGEITFGTAPEVLLNGQPARLAPGARIRGDDNLLRLPVALAEHTLLVHYTREPTTGLLLDVWILNEQERRREPWPRTEEQARRWSFDPIAQTWSRR
jgi:hypothetical protein